MMRGNTAEAGTRGGTHLYCEQNETSAAAVCTFYTRVSRK